MKITPDYTFAIQPPPSLWDLYRGMGKRRSKKRPYKCWLDAVGWQLKTQNRPKEPIDRSFRVKISIPRQTDRADLDNYAKAPMDALQKFKIISNDRLCEELHLKWHDPAATPDCLVEIEAIPEGRAAA